MNQNARCQVSRLLPAILTDKLSETRAFYVRLLGLTASFDSDWFVELVSAAPSAVALGIWKRTHDLVPPEFRKHPSGFVLSFQVADADAAYAFAQHAAVKIVVPLRNEAYGQRHFMTEDPNGILVDVTSPIEMSAEFRVAYLDKSE